MNNPVCWFEIYVSDMERAKQFYETVLGVELTDLDTPNDADFEMKAFPADMEKHGATGALVKMEGASVGHNSVIIYFSCEDCAVEESRIEAAGGKVDTPKFSIGEHGFITMATDTDGNSFGLHSLN